MKEQKEKIMREKSQMKEEVDHHIRELINKTNLELDEIQNQKRDVTDSIK